ncbi:MAG: hypothetical protein RLO21_13775 [Nitratireductor sp.]
MDWLDEPILTNKLVCNGQEPLTNRYDVARKAHVCDLCGGPIAKGERIRAESRRSDDGKRIQTRRVCVSCCAAIGRGERP